MRYYWEQRGRIGINTIINTDTESIELTKIQFGFPGSDYCEVENLSYEGIVKKSNSREKNKNTSQLPIYINIDQIRENCMHLSSIATSDIVVKNEPYKDENSGITIEKIKDKESNKIVGLKINLPFVIDINNKKILKDRIKATDLLDDELNRLADEIEKPIYFAYEDTPDDRKEFIVDRGSKRLSITEDISKGIIIPQLKLKIKLVDHIIHVEKSEQIADIFEVSS